MCLNCMMPGEGEVRFVLNFGGVIGEELKDRWRGAMERRWSYILLGNPFNKPLPCFSDTSRLQVHRRAITFKNSLLPDLFVSKIRIRRCIFP